MNENRFVPEYLGLIVNGVVIYNVNWVDIVDKELILKSDKLKLDKFNSFNEVHLENIFLILVTFSVLKLDKSNDINDLHP